MKSTKIALVRFRFRKLISYLRRNYYIMLGLQIESGAKLGKITCEWPHRVSIGKNSTIQDDVDFRTEHPFSSENFIKIGDRVFIGRKSEFNATCQIIIGNDCMIASNTTFVDVGHEMKRCITINQQPVVSEKIVLEDDVWIGSGCIVLKGVTIGKGSVVGAGSVINKSIPEFQIWAGSPARFIRNRK